MTKYCGKDFVVARGNDDGPPETFTTIAAMRSTSMTINNEQVDVTTKDDVPWRQLIECGVRSMSITLSGVFTDSAVHDNLVLDVLGDGSSTSILNFQLTSGRGDTFAGSFQIASMERAGEYNGEETFSLTLESAGDITYTAAT